MPSAASLPKSLLKFSQQLTLMKQARIGLVFIRTREPFRALEHMVQWAGNRPFYTWDVVQGYRARKTGGWQADASVGPNPATALNKFAGTVPDAEPVDGSLLLMSPEPWLAPAQGQPNPAFVQGVAQAAENLPADPKGRTLFLLVNESFKTPEEHQHSSVSITLELPEQEELQAQAQTIVGDYTAAMGISAFDFAERDYRLLGRLCCGLTLSEAANAVSQALIQSTEAGTQTLDSVVAYVSKAKADAVLATGYLEVMPSVPMADIGGLDNIKAYMQDIMLCDTPEAAAFGVQPVKGIGVFGVPGTGKSMVAAAASAALNRPALKLNVGALMGGLVGQTEAQTRSALATIRGLGHCVIVVEEADRTIGGGGGGGTLDSGVTQRLIGTLLDFMQNQTKAFFIFTGNDPRKIDPALTRPGRLDSMWSVTLPEQKDRESILAIKLRLANQGLSGIDLAKVAEAAQGFAGSELEQAVKEATKRAWVESKGRSGVTTALLLDEVRRITPNSKAFAEQLEAQRQWAELNARPASSTEVAPTAKPVKARIPVGGRRFAAGDN